MNTNIILSIQENYGSLSKSHKKIAEYILSNYDDAVFMTASKLGKITHTSESTVVRFANELGYEGYSSFLKDLSAFAKTNLDKKKDINSKAFFSNIPDSVRLILEKDINNLKNTIAELDISNFELSVDSIVKARHIYIIGLGASASVASVLYIYLNYIRSDIHLISSAISNEIFEKLMHIESDDLLISFGFPEYSIRTLKAMEFANMRKASIISITDSSYSPFSMYASSILIAKCDMTDNLVSMTAVMSLVNTLIMAIIKKSNNSYLSNIDRFNKDLEDLY